MNEPTQIINPAAGSGTKDTLRLEKKEVVSGNTTLLISYSSTNPGLQLSASLNFDLASVLKAAFIAFVCTVALLLLLDKAPPETAKTAVELLVYACKLMLGSS
jgi:hypothetical protein